MGDIYDEAVEYIAVSKSLMDSFLANPFWAIEHESNEEVLKKLVMAHNFNAININEVRPINDRQKRDTLLGFAAKCGRVKVVAALLAMGANPNIKDSSGQTAVVGACTRLSVPSDFGDDFHSCDPKIYIDLIPTFDTKETREYGECRSPEFPLFQSVMEVFIAAGVELERPPSPVLNIQSDDD